MATALAIQGIGGMNSFSAGFLYHLRQEKFKLQIIFVTSGAILCLYDFLSDDPEPPGIGHKNSSFLCYLIFRQNS
jgi:predicted patatin/cPLA2 family phospholipase